MSAKLRRIPKTSDLEEKENQLRQEFNDFNAYKESEELARFRELEAFVLSKEFANIKKEINSKKYQGSEPYANEKKYNALKKSKRIKTYLQLNESKELKDYEAFSTSSTLASYEELNQFYTSEEFANFKKSLTEQKAEKLKEIKEKQNKHKNLKKKFKWFFSFKDSVALSDFIKFEESIDLQNFIELEQEAKSIDIAGLKHETNQQKKAKAQELKLLIKRQKELKSQNKKHKGDEPFEGKGELDEVTQKINSGELKREIEEISLENKDEYKKYKEYERLKKSSQIKNYFKLKDSTKYKRFLELDGSQEIESFLELEEEVSSPEFKSHMEEVKNLKFENTEEFKKFEEYKKLKSSTEIKQYFKFKNSQKLAIYNEVSNSQELTDYVELENYINSEEFKEEKKYLLIKDKFKLSEEHKQEEEYKQLKDSEKIKWYYKLEKKNDFDRLHEWELTFEDDFEEGKLDTEKWMSGYFWGKNLLKDDYVQVNEKQFFKEGNLEINNSNLKVITKQEKIQGKVWDPSLGFYKKEFDYTSGLINTGQYFRQQFGLFKAKIKVNHSYPVHHAFWLLGEKITPEIDIFKYGAKSGSKAEIANYWNGDGNINKFNKTIGGVDFSKDYFIYSLEWTKEKLTWKINGRIVHEQTKGIPQEPMYIVLSSGINKEGNANTPCSMEVDWVKAYKKKE